MLSATLLVILATNPLYAKTTTDKSTLTSAEIGTLATIAAIDKTEILLGVVASNKKVDPGVTDFAQMMINQHGSNLTQIIEMADAQHVNQLTGGAADKLAADGKK